MIDQDKAQDILLRVGFDIRWVSIIVCATDGTFAGLRLRGGTIARLGFDTVSDGRSSGWEGHLNSRFSQPLLSAEIEVNPKWSSLYSGSKQ